MVPYISIGGYADQPRIPHLSLEVNRGELVIIAGGPGNGKSNLMKCIAGLRRPSRGIIRVLGSEPGTMRSREKSVFIFQKDNYAPDIILRYQLEQRVSLLRDVPAREARELVYEWCKDMDLATEAEMRPEKLNLSQLQIFSLAPLVLCEPSVAVMDEPLVNVASNLVPDAVQLILGILDRAAVLALVQRQSPLFSRADRTVVLQ